MVHHTHDSNHVHLACDELIQFMTNSSRVKLSAKAWLTHSKFNSGLRFLVRVIKNDASLKYSSRGHIRFS